MAFRTNLGTGEIPVTGIFGTGGEPSGINDNGQRVYSRTSSASNHSIGNYVESLSERIVDEGSWNPLTAEYSTPPFSASSGCWNVGNSREASPYIDTLKVDNAIGEDNIITIGGGGKPQAVALGRIALPCDCEPYIFRPSPQWGAGPDGRGGPIYKDYEVEHGTEIDCQSSRNKDRGLLNHKVFYFSGVYAELTGIFALMPNLAEFDGNPLWINSLNQEDPVARCWGPSHINAPLENELKKAINGGVSPGPDCTYRHDTLAYRGTGLADVGVSGTNWKGWCKPEYDFENEFYESRADCNGKLGYLYACDSFLTNFDGVPGFDFRISELTPLDSYSLEDSCDCLARYDNEWKSAAYFPAPAQGSKGIWVFDAKQDWDASNSGTGYRPTLDENFRRYPPTQVYWTGNGCWLRQHSAENERKETYKPELDKTKVFAIVATGGGGPGAGDNIPPYWSDTECDWIYAIREVVAGDCTDESKKIEGSPSGPTIEIGLTKLHDAQCGFSAVNDPLPCPGIDWICSLSGTGEAPGTSGYCTSTYNRGPLYPNGDYVCYADGTGNVPGASGPYWIVNSDSNWDGVTGVACNWTYDLQYYNPYIPGPSGALQTGILESAISTGCA